MANATDVLQPIVLTLSPLPVWTFPPSPPGTPTSTTTREVLVVTSTMTQEILVVKGGTVWARINQ